MVGKLQGGERNAGDGLYVWGELLRAHREVRGREGEIGPFFARSRRALWRGDLNGVEEACFPHRSLCVGNTCRSMPQMGRQRVWLPNGEERLRTIGE